MTRQRKWGRFEITESNKDAFETAQSELECLRDEMDEWRSSIEGTNLEYSDKYERIEECHDSLDSAVQSLEYIDSDRLDDRGVQFYIEKKRNEPRWLRCNNAYARLEAVKDFLETLRDDYEIPMTREQEQELHSDIDLLEDAIDEISCIDFPVMFG